MKGRKTMNRFKIAQNLAVIGLVIFWGSTLATGIMPKGYLLIWIPIALYGWLLGIVAIFVGGLGTACRMAGKVGTWIRYWISCPLEKAGKHSSGILSRGG